VKKKQATKNKADVSVRFGHFVGFYLPGAAKKLGRATGKGAVIAKRASGKFSTAFMEGFKEA
jgi:hypothetical protein